MGSAGRGDGVEAGGPVAAAAPVLGRGLVRGGVTFAVDWSDEGDWVNEGPGEVDGALHEGTC